MTSTGGPPAGRAPGHGRGHGPGHGRGHGRGHGPGHWLGRALRVFAPLFATGAVLLSVLGVVALVAGLGDDGVEPVLDRAPADGVLQVPGGGGLRVAVAGPAVEPEPECTADGPSEPSVFDVLGVEEVAVADGAGAATPAVVVARVVPGTTQDGTTVRCSGAAGDLLLLGRGGPSVAWLAALALPLALLGAVFAVVGFALRATGR